MSESAKIIDLFNRYVMPTYSPNLALVRAKGTKVWDADGKVYLDFLAGISVLNVGHSHPKVIKAIKDQVTRLTHVSNLYYTENQAKLAEKLSGLALHGKCFFCNSGAEANESMIKLARLWGNENGKYEIICMKNSFHGRTLVTAAATGQSKIQKGFEPMPEGFCHADYNDIASVAALVNDRTVAVLLEAIQGEGGIISAEDEFMKAVRRLCNEKELLMLCDEVQCGMGRTGDWFAFQASGVEPDVSRRSNLSVEALAKSDGQTGLRSEATARHAGAEPDAFTLAKALGSGYPIGALVSSPKLADVFQPGNHASTFGGTPLACAAALATLEVIEEERLVERARQVGDEFKQSLAAFIDKYEHVKEARGRGLMLGIVLDKPSKPLVAMMRDAGLLGLATAENVVRFLPPLNVKHSEIKEALKIMDDCLARWHGSNERI